MEFPTLFKKTFLYGLSILLSLTSHSTLCIIVIDNKRVAVLFFEAWTMFQSTVMATCYKTLYYLLIALKVKKVKLYFYLSWYSLLLSSSCRIRSFRLSSFSSRDLRKIGWKYLKAIFTFWTFYFRFKAFILYNKDHS